MRHLSKLLPLFLLSASVFMAADTKPPSLIAQVKTASLAGDFATAKAELSQYRAKLGVTPEYIEAFSWIGRGELAKHETALAEANAAETRALCETELKRRKLDAEPHLPTALGAAIEVEGQSLGLENRRDEAVVFLRDELKHWQGTSIAMRIRKNINLLTLEGKPVPVLEVASGIGSVKPQPLSAHRGHPVLLFLWAHWCVDCKAEVAVIEKLQAAYGARGLVVVAPTQHYGYVAGGKEVPRAVETKYMGEVFAQYYAGLGKIEVPVSEENFRLFGVSTTPTLLLLDGQGIVRLYNPGALTYEALAARIEPLLQHNSL